MEKDILNELAKEIHSVAIQHGWWDEPRSFGEIISLCHSELSEALEEYRNSKPMIYFLKQDPMSTYFGVNDTDICTDMKQWKGEKPEGIAVELADCVIRILDYCGHVKFDIDKVAMLYQYRSEMPKNFGTLIAECHYYISDAYAINLTNSLVGCMMLIYKWAEINGVDMDETIRIKHRYNKTRSYRHGGKAL